MVFLIKIWFWRAISRTVSVCKISHNFFRLAEKRAEAMRVALAEGIDGAIDEEDEEGSEGEEEVR